MTLSYPPAPADLPASAASMIYLCVVSGFNLPELEAVVTRRPGQVLLLVSDFFQPHARRLADQILLALPDCQLHLLGQEQTQVSLGGDDMLEAQRWAAEVLLPLLPPPGSAEVVLNITGGTKAFLAGLLLVYPWTTLDYRAKNKRHLHSVRFDGGHNRAPTLGDKRWLPIPDLPPMALAKLQAETAMQLPLNTLISRQPLATLALAEQLWHGELTQDAALDYLLSQLELLWVKQAEAPKSKVAHCWLPWPPEPAARAELVDGWLTPLAGIADRTSLFWDERGIRVVGNSTKGKKDPLRRWLSGAWLEQLAEHWLQCAGVPASAIARNVVRSSEKGESSSAREADLLVLFNCQATVVEAKADLPRGTAAKSMEEQLSSLGDLFGSTRKVLLIGPRLLAGLNDKGRKNLETRLRSNNGAQLCIDRESLLKAIDPTLIQALTPSAGGDSGR